MHIQVLSIFGFYEEKEHNGSLHFRVLVNSSDGT